MNEYWRRILRAKLLAIAAIILVGVVIEEIARRRKPGIPPELPG
jgi:hypothetical protein